MLRFGLLSSTMLLAGPAMAQLPAPAVPHTILVRGTAEQEVEPEKLDLLLTYRFTDNVKAGERAQNQEAGLQQVLSQAGIGENKLVLEELSASGYGGLSKVNNTTVALNKTYRLTLDNPKLVTTLIPQLAQAGADNLFVVNLQSSKLAAAKAEAATQAIADARQKAALAIRAAGGQLGTLVSVEEVQPDGQLTTRARSANKMGNVLYEAYQTQPTGPAASLRKIKVVAVYELVFEIKP